MNKIIASFALAMVLTLAVTSYTGAVQSDLENNLIRLHIIADSDSEADQAVKLKVRDAVIKEMSSEFKNSDIEKSREAVINNLAKIEETADRVLSENGFTYRSKAEYGKFTFPRKAYSSVTLPAGEYYGIRVTLGSGSGHNWWCVMYPPMCFTEDSRGKMSGESDEKLKESLDGETYDIITGSENVQVKFKIVELAGAVKDMIWH